MAADLLAATRDPLSQSNEADEWLALADAIVERLQAYDSILEAWILNERGNLDFTRGEFVAAEDAQRRAIALKKKLLGPMNPDVATTSSSLACTLFEQGRLDDAYSAAHEALAIRRTHGDDASALFAFGLAAEGEVLLDEGRINDADTDIDHAITLESQSGIEKGALLVGTLTLKAELFLARHQTEAALPLLKRVETLQREMNETNPVFRADTQFPMARALVASSVGDRNALHLAATACEAYDAGHYLRRKARVLSWFNSLPSRSRMSQFAESCADIDRSAESRDASGPHRRNPARKSQRGGLVASHG